MLPGRLARIDSSEVEEDSLMHTSWVTQRTGNIPTTTTWQTQKHKLGTWRVSVWCFGTFENRILHEKLKILAFAAFPCHGFERVCALHKDELQILLDSWQGKTQICALVRHPHNSSGHPESLRFKLSPHMRLSFRNVLFTTSLLTG